jgi:hypothetical protein
MNFVPYVLIDNFTRREVISSPESITMTENNQGSESIAQPQPGLELTPLSLVHFAGIRKWTYFFSILGFIFIGLMVVIAFSIGTIFSSVAGDMPFPGFFFTGIYLLLALLYFFPVLYLYRFSAQAKKGLAEKNVQDMEMALGNLKAHYTFVGYMVVIMLILYAVVLAGIGIGAMIMSS